MDNKKRDFIISELWILAWGASVQRAKLYGEKNPSDNKFISAQNKFREDIVSFLIEKIIPQYEKGCSEQQHYANIEALIDYANKVNPGILGSSGYKYGVAQKLLNLALKYYWCLGLITEPHHCPIDRIIINKTKYSGKTNWTHILHRHEYENIINDIKLLAKKDGFSVPEWELSSYNRREQSSRTRKPRRTNIYTASAVNNISAITLPQDYLPTLTIEEVRRLLGEKYIEDPKQKSIYIDRAVAFKLWANYISSLLLDKEAKLRGVAVPWFTRDEIKARLKQIIPHHYDIEGARISGLNTSDVKIGSTYNMNLPCLEHDTQTHRFRFVGFLEQDKTPYSKK